MSNSDPRDATKDIIDDIKKTFKKYTRTARQKSWDAVISKKGEALIKKLILNPEIPIVGIPRLLNFKDWVEPDINDWFGPSEHQ